MITDQSDAEVMREHMCAEDVNRFVGFAVHKMKEIYARNDDDEDVYRRDCSVALRDMAVCETDIIGNEEYVKKYYPLSDQFLNQGRLTLISPKHIA